jgi:hypothetical protein
MGGQREGSGRHPGAYMDARELFRMWSDVFNEVDVIRYIYREKEPPGFVDTSLP